MHDCILIKENWDLASVHCVLWYASCDATNETQELSHCKKYVVL